jgi:hypothetical protein
MQDPHDPAQTRLLSSAPEQSAKKSMFIVSQLGESYGSVQTTPPLPKFTFQYHALRAR